jgi:hypothetical protein
LFLNDGETSEEESDELEPRKKEPGSGTVSFNGIDLLVVVCRGSAEKAVISAAEQTRTGSQACGSTEASG